MVQIGRALWINVAGGHLRNRSRSIHVRTCLCVVRCAPHRSDSLATVNYSVDPDIDSNLVSITTLYINFLVKAASDRPFFKDCFRIYHRSTWPTMNLH